MAKIRTDTLGGIVNIIGISTPLVYLFAVLLGSDKNYNLIVATLLCLILIASVLFASGQLPSALTERIFFLWLTQKPEADVAFEQLQKDGTKILQRGNECNELKFATLYGSKRFNYVFIALDVTQDINLIHFAILGKLRELQRFFFIPVIYIIDDPSLKKFSEREQVKIHSIFIALLKVYLQGSPYAIMNGSKGSQKLKASSMDLGLDKISLDALSSTTLGEIRDVLSCQRTIDDSTPLIKILQPIIEVLKVYRLQSHGTAVICGKDLLKFWEFGANKLNIEPTVFLLPTILDLNGSILMPKQLKATIRLPMKEEEFSAITNTHLSWPVIRQIYSLFIMKLPSSIRGNIIIKKADNSAIEITDSNPIDSIENTPENIALLTNDLKKRVPCITKTLFCKANKSLF